MKFVEYPEVDGPEIRPSILRCPFSPCNARIIASDNLSQVKVHNSPSLVNVLKDQKGYLFVANVTKDLLGLPGLKEMKPMLKNSSIS